MDDGVSVPLRDGLLADFDEGRAASLVESRNRNVGNILLAERAVFYLQILYRVLLFRRDHELEPLHEDIYDAVRTAQEGLAVEQGYPLDVFRQDMAQLVDWKLIEERMEMERLRGYRDTRRRKFRYSLTEDARAFLEWLEDRALADLEAGEEDTRDVLEELCGALGQLRRMLNAHGTKRAREDDPRRVLYQLFRLEELTHQANGHLAEFNARLLAFAIRGYDLGEARDILRGLDDFVHRFLRRVSELRGKIIEGVDHLLLSRSQEKLAQCAEAMDAERRHTPQLLRRSRDYRSQIRIPFALDHFYQDGGKLDQICHRISDSAMHVWRKLHAHLRELERRNHRVEDIRDRIADIARLPEESVPHDFMRALVASAGMVADPNCWDDAVKAMPPQPRRETPRTRNRAASPIRQKQHGNRPAISLDEQRLRELREYFLDTLGSIDDSGKRIGQGVYTRDEEAARIIELAKAGLLGEGRQLSRIGLQLNPEPGTPVDIQFAEARLRFNDMLLRLHER